MNLPKTWKPWGDHPVVVAIFVISAILGIYAVIRPSYRDEPVVPTLTPTLTLTATPTPTPTLTHTATPTVQVATSTPTPPLTSPSVPSSSNTNSGSGIQVNTSGTSNTIDIDVNPVPPTSDASALATSQARQVEKEATARAASATTAAEETKSAELNNAKATAEAISESQRLAAESQALREKNPETAILVALEANKHAHTFESEKALRDALDTPSTDSGMSLPMGQNLIEDLAFSPNGSMLVTAGSEDMGGMAKVWELDTGKLIATLHDRNDYLLTAKFLDDDQVLTYSATGRMLTWDARTGKQRGTFRAEDANDLDVPRVERFTTERRFSQDNKVIINRFDHYVAIYDIATGNVIQEIIPPPDHSALDAIYENGVATILLRNDLEETISIGTYDFQNSQEPQLLKLNDLTGSQSKITAGRITRSRSLVACGDDKGVIKVFDMASGEMLRELKEHSDEIINLNFSTDDMWLVSSSKDKTAKVWDLSTNSQSLFTLTVDKPLGYILLSPDKRWLAGIRQEGALLGGDIQVWNLNKLKSQFSEPIIPNSYEFGGFINDGDGFFLIPGPSTGELPILVKKIDGSESYELPPYYGLYCTQCPQVRLITSMDAKQFYTYSLQDGTLTGLDKQTGGIVSFSNPPIGENNRNSIVFSPNLKFALEFDETDSPLIWDVASGTKIGRLANAHIGKLSAWSSDSNYLVTVKSPENSFFDFEVWEVASGNKVAELKTSDGLAFRATFSPDNQLIAGTSADLKLRIWDWRNSKIVLTLDNLIAPPGIANFQTTVDFIRSFEFSKDGKTILIADNSDSAKLFDIATGKQIRPFDGHSDVVTNASFSPDGKQIVTTSFDRTVRLWDSATGKETTRLDDYEYAMYSPNGRYLVAWNRDGGGAAYLVQLEDLIKETKHRVTRELNCSERVKYLHEKLECSS